MTYLISSEDGILENKSASLLPKLLVVYSVGSTL